MIMRKQETRKEIIEKLHLHYARRRTYLAIGMTFAEAEQRAYRDVKYGVRGVTR